MSILHLYILFLLFDFVLDFCPWLFNSGLALVGHNSFSKSMEICGLFELI